MVGICLISFACQCYNWFFGIAWLHFNFHFLSYCLSRPAVLLHKFSIKFNFLSASVIKFIKSAFQNYYDIFRSICEQHVLEPCKYILAFLIFWSFSVWVSRSKVLFKDLKWIAFIPIGSNYRSFLPWLSFFQSEFSTLIKNCFSFLVW